MVLALALAALPSLGVDASALAGRIHIGPSLDYLERAFDHAKYGEISSEPWLDMTIPTIADPARDPVLVKALEEQLGITTTSPREVTKPGQRDLAGRAAFADEHVLRHLVAAGADAPQGLLLECIDGRRPELVATAALSAGQVSRDIGGLRLERPNLLELLSF